jgi:hypothetical protein
MGHKTVQRIPDVIYIESNTYRGLGGNQSNRLSSVFSTIIAPLVREGALPAIDHIQTWRSRGTSTMVTAGARHARLGAGEGISGPADQRTGVEETAPGKGGEAGTHQASRCGLFPGGIPAAKGTSAEGMMAGRGSSPPGHRVRSFEVM